jgi:hypothetical protein
MTTTLLHQQLPTGVPNVRRSARPPARSRPRCAEERQTRTLVRAALQPVLQLRSGSMPVASYLPLCGALPGQKPSTRKTNQEYLDIWRAKFRAKWDEKIAARTAVQKEKGARHCASTAAAEAAATCACPAPAPFFIINDRFFMPKTIGYNNRNTALNHASIAHRKASRAVTVLPSAGCADVVD